jgi:hypothetical protein
MLNLLFAAAVAATCAADTIKLPPPDRDSGVTVMQALKARHSERAFSDKDVPMDVLSGVLWAANGLSTVCRGTMDRDALKKALNFGDNIILHLNHPIGCPKK